jgi:hypothetical protein
LEPSAPLITVIENNKLTHANQRIPLVSYDLDVLNHN